MYVYMYNYVCIYIYKVFSALSMIVASVGFFSYIISYRPPGEASKRCATRVCVPLYDGLCGAAATMQHEQVQGSTTDSMSCPLNLRTQTPTFDIPPDLQKMQVSECS